MNELLVMMTIAGRRAAMRAVEVQSVIELDTITPVPRSAKFVVGMTALRSQALTVIDCRSAIGIDPAGYPADSRAAVAEVDGFTYALVVDAIADIAEATSEPETVAGGFGAEWDGAAIGMIETGAGPAVLIDLARLIAGPRRRAA